MGRRRAYLRCAWGAHTRGPSVRSAERRAEWRSHWIAMFLAAVHSTAAAALHGAAGCTAEAWPCGGAAESAMRRADGCTSSSRPRAYFPSPPQGMRLGRSGPCGHTPCGCAASLGKERARGCASHGEVAPTSIDKGRRSSYTVVTPTLLQQPCAK